MPKIFETIRKTILQIIAYDKWRGQLYDLGVDMLDNEVSVKLIDGYLYEYISYIIAGDNCTNEKLVDVIRDDISWWIYEHVDKIIELSLYDLDYNNLEGNATIKYDVNDINNFIDYLYRRYYLMPDHFVYKYYEEDEEDEDDRFKI